ncbi:hypothetical protein [Microbulbifer halophilus]|uniref:Ig-like domain-containing protein n=1 Tax=Microbulbifer halophilus TaxID=453963 RepID=A0ABW5E8G3_9GAMM|nr:hypothetical protein [Microbulbifer halophilus]MCW8125301.1 hypothetical protein [Microbulbifer halophilus]
MNIIKFRKLFSVVLLLGAGLLYQLPAGAQQVDATCLGNASVQFNPPLKLLPQATSFTSTGNLNCMFSEDFSTHTATLKNVTGNGSLSCLVNTDVVGTTLVDWDNQPDSLVHWESVQVELYDTELNLPSVPRVFALQGEVVSGKFQNSSVLITYNDIPTLAYLDCLLDGLQSIGGPVHVTFVEPAM